MSWSEQKNARGAGLWRNSTAYKRARLFVLDRAGYRCEIEGERCTRRATQAHHMDGVNEANLCDTDRMQAACAPCNGSVGDPSRHDPAPAPRTAW